MFLFIKYILKFNNSIFRFATKCGILGGTIYYTKQIGIWDSSEVTYELSRQSIAYLTPYINKLEKEVPITAEVSLIHLLLYN